MPIRKRRAHGLIQKNISFASKNFCFCAAKKCIFAANDSRFFVTKRYFFSTKNDFFMSLLVISERKNDMTHNGHKDAEREYPSTNTTYFECF